MFLKHKFEMHFGTEEWKDQVGDSPITRNITIYIKIADCYINHKDSIATYDIYK